MTGETREVPRWLWNSVVWGLAVLVLAVGGLVIALALGWNDPRPRGSPTWQAPGLPRILEAPTESTVVELLPYPDASADTDQPEFILEGITAAASGPAFNGYGIAFNAQDEAHYSVFALGSDGYYAILSVAGDEETELVAWQQFPHIRRGREANRLRIECSSPTCDFYINDEFATTVEAAGWSGGIFGLWVRSFEDQAVKAEFSSLAVWARSADDG